MCNMCNMHNICVIRAICAVLQSFHKLLHAVKQCKSNHMEGIMHFTHMIQTSKFTENAELKTGDHGCQTCIILD